MPEDSRAQTRPNVLLLMTDDQGAWALGSKMPELQTPTLDRLQNEGTSFDHAFCASPVCSPARASVMTGRMPSAHGIHDWLTPGALAHAKQQNRPFAPDFLEGLNGADTIARMLSREGYYCGMVGKWHVGSSDSPAEGFDYWYAHQVGGGPYYEAPIWARDPETGVPASPAVPSTEREYFTDAVTRESIDFLSRAAADDSTLPFFLQVNWTAPHDPWFGDNHPTSLKALYSDTDFPSVPTPEYHPWFVQERFRRATSDRHGALSGYCASITGVDESVRSILDWLESRDLLDNTIVIFTSDNGFSCGHHGIWGKGNATFPLNFWEPSITVPLIVRWPARVRAGAVVEDAVSATSILETISELTETTPLDDGLRAGRSFAPLILRGTISAREENPIVIYDEYGANRMIRSDQWKLVMRRSGPNELYNLAEDPLEMESLYGDLGVQGVVRLLEQDLTGWFNDHHVSGLDGWSARVDGTGQSRP